MPTLSTLGSTHWLLVALLAASAVVGCAPAEPKRASMAWSPPVSLVLDESGPPTQATWMDGVHVYTLPFEARLRGVFAAAQSIEVVELLHGGDGPSPIAALVVQTPSLLGSPLERCGAGTEDALIIVTRNRNQIEFLDSIVLQSCFDSLEVLNDTGQDLSRIVRPLPPPGLLAVVWVRPPEFEPVEYEIGFDGVSLHATETKR